MKVILLEELKGKGGEGDIVEVARGHAVNYLFPRKIAIEATAGNLKQLEQRKHNIAKRETGRLDSADKIFAALNEKTLTIRARVGDEGQLFGSVTSMQIAEEVLEQFGVEVDRKKIDIAAAIKTAGEHVVMLSIYRDIKAEITVNVVDERAVEVASEEVEADSEVVETAEEEEALQEEAAETTETGEAAVADGAEASAEDTE